MVGSVGLLAAAIAIGLGALGAGIGNGINRFKNSRRYRSSTRSTWSSSNNNVHRGSIS